MFSGGAIQNLRITKKLNATPFNNYFFANLKKLNPYKLVLFTGLVFLAGTVVDLYYEMSVKKVLLIIRQITWQSNFYAFLLAFLYLWNPKLLIFYSNYLFILVATLLFTSAVIFFFVLLPAFLNLEQLYQSLITPTAPLIFWNIWNHVVTPLTFLRLLIYRFSNKNKSSRWTISRKTAWFRYKIYWMIQLLGNIYFSIDPNQPSAYGAFSNWYWGKKANGVSNGDNSLSISYNFQLSFFAFFIVMAVTCFLFFFLWHLFAPKNEQYSYSHKLLNYRSF